MDNLLKEIRRVQRRLALQRFLAVLGWCWFASLLAAAAVIVAARFYPIRVLDWQWLAGFLAAGLVAAIAWTFFAITPALQAALEIDQRFGLKERISSTLAMNRADRETEAGQALVADADARLKRVAVEEKFPVRPSRHLLLPLAPALALAAVMIFRPPMQEQLTAAVTDNPTDKPQVEAKAIDDLRQRLADRRKDAEKKEGLRDATELLKKVEEGTKDLQKEPLNGPQREKALVKLNDYVRELQERKKQLGGGSEELKREMEKVKDISRGPADDLKNALAKSDFDKAAKALEKLQEKLAGSKLDPAKKEELAKQVEQLKKNIDKMAQQAKDAQADLQKRADQMRQAGNQDAAGKLEDEIQKLQQQGPQIEALQKLANKLGQCTQQMQAGNNTQAAEAMQDAMQQLQEMARQQNELQTLDDAMQMLADARKQMNCENCGGKGCEMCQGGMGEGKGKKDGKPGQGLGEGLGDGARPDAKTNGSFFDSRVRQTVNKGAGQITGLAGGPNLKLQAETEIQNETSAIEHGNTDPLSGQRLPKKQSEHAQQYFDSFREGK
jgi:hypothetical protein